MRMQMRRFTRLTNAFSKKVGLREGLVRATVEFHLYAVALHFMWYNYRGIHTTPAMAAGLTNRVWTVSDILELLQGN
jgi:hypothetical protein